jgi:hypothetical protein
MSVFLQPLQTVTVGSGGAASISFTNIPQTYTDLKIEISAKDTTTGSAGWCNIAILFNGSSSNFSQTFVFGYGTGSTSGRDTNGYARISSSLTGTNIFSNNSMYIPNYTSSNYKSYIIDEIQENNSSTAYYAGQFLIAGLWSNTSAISSIQFNALTSIMQYSKFSLYGVLRQGI